MAEIICNITVKPAGSSKVKIQGYFPIHVANVGECLQLAQALNCMEIQNLVVKSQVPVSPAVISGAVVRDGTINGKWIRAQIYVGILSLRKFIVKNSGCGVSLVMQWGDARAVADAEADLSRLMPRPYQPA